MGWGWGDGGGLAGGGGLWGGAHRGVMFDGRGGICFWAGKKEIKGEDSNKKKKRI